MEGFVLGKPKLVCRWRLSGGELPLKNRHLRALAARRVDGETLSPTLIAWVKQHIEWTLRDGSQRHPDGVLMLVVDEGGAAAMTVGAYEELAHTSVNDLALRAVGANVEAKGTGVSPEDLWVMRDGMLAWGIDADQTPCGASSLVFDLATTLGITTTLDPGLLRRVRTLGVERSSEVFLSSDEYGVICASDRPCLRSKKFAASYEKLLERRREHL